MTLGVTTSVKQVVCLATLDVACSPVHLRDLAVIKIVPALGKRIHRICRVMPEARAAEMV